MRSGIISASHGYLRFSGNYGLSWASFNSPSSTSNLTGPSAYDLSFDAITVDTSYGPNSRWNGFPLRCLPYLYLLLYTSCAAGISILQLAL